MYEYILFDLDGTLTDPGIGITNSIRYALRKFGIEEEDRSQLYKFIGPPLVESFQMFYGFSEEDAKKATAYYREYYRPTGMYENEVYDGIPELLQRIKEGGRRILLATSKPQEFAIEILKHFGLYDYFDIIAGASMDETRNKKTQVIAYALELANIHTPQELAKAVMIGDRHYDISGAKAFGLDSIGVLFGYGDCEELSEAGATYLAEKPEDILRWIG